MSLELTVSSPGELSVLRQQLRRLLPRITFPRLLRIVLIVTLVTGAVLGQLSLLKARAYEEVITDKTLTNPPSVQTQGGGASKQPSQPKQALDYLSRSMPFAPQDVSSSQPFDGLGDLSFYTYVKHPINSSSCSCGKREVLVNVANGNLLVHSVDVQITGTAGVDLDIEGYYNSQGDTSLSLDHGKNWTLSVGHDLRLDTSNASTGITLYGPSGYAAYFAYDSTNSKYTDAPGLNATLKEDGSSSKYALTFHKTGIEWIFGADNGEQRPYYHLHL
jgi:hypothetical protein